MKFTLFLTICIVVLCGILSQGVTQVAYGGLTARPNSAGYFRCWACNGTGRLPSGAVCPHCHGRGYRNIHNMRRGRSPIHRSPNTFRHRNHGSPACFIATAAYGTPWEHNVINLRHFREKYLLTTLPGKWFVSSYYKFSPPIASFIENRTWARFLTRAILTPIVIVAGTMVGDTYSILIFTLSVILVTLLILRRRKKHTDILCYIE